MMGLIAKGGPLMYPILFCGVAGLFFIIERILFLRLRLKTAAARIEAALSGAEGQGAQSREELRDRLSLAVQAEVSALSRFVPAIGTLSTAATLLGLLGTVIGNIGAFEVLSQTGFGSDAAGLAGAIAEALLTTAFGLSVSIPLLVAHNALASRINREADTLEQRAGEILLAHRIQS